MSARPRLLDLFCGAGGCSVGYHRAGFDVTGVDHEFHEAYPDSSLSLLGHPLTGVECRFMLADALDVVHDRALLSQFDAVHASPPCQWATTMSNRYPAAQAAWPNLIAPVREALLRWGGLYVIENVVGARAALRDPVILHGAQFGLGVHRPRLFESNAPLVAPPHISTRRVVIGVYGDRPDGRMLNRRADGTVQRAARSLADGRVAMGIDWMGWRDLCEAIPPAYTQCLGEQLVDQLTAARA